MNSQLTDFIIEERFEPLRAYFKDVMAEDLTSGLVSVEDILDATKPQHRLLMTVFIKKYLLPIGRPNSLISSPSSMNSKTLVNGHLDLKGNVASNDLQRASWMSPVSSICELPEVAADPNVVMSMDLSNNFLSNKDLKDVLMVLEQLKSCRIVNLSNNRLKADGDVQILKQILALRNDMKVMICGNALASNEGKQFLSELSDEDLVKLIWIPRHWYNALGWHNAIAENKWDVVYRAHDSFYGKMEL